MDVVAVKCIMVHGTSRYMLAIYGMHRSKLLLWLVGRVYGVLVGLSVGVVDWDLG